MSIINPFALAEAQDDDELFEVMEPPPVDFELFGGLPISTGIIKARHLVHRDQDWHSSVHIWILDVSKKLLLLQQRSVQKDTFPGRWDISAAGHIPAKHQALPTAIAELQEELGIVAEPNELQYQFTCPAKQAPAGGCNCYEYVYFLQKDSLTLKCALGTKEVTAIKWISLENLETAWKTRDVSFVPRVDNYRRAFSLSLKQMLME